MIVNALLKTNWKKIDAHMTFTKGRKLLEPVAYKQWYRRKLAHIECFSSGIALNWFLKTFESYKNDRFVFVSALKIFSQKL